MMAEFPSGVAIVTALEPAGVPRGMTCSALCGVSLEPPILLVCLRAASPTLGAVLASATFAVNLLHHRARRTAELFASGDPGRFARVEWSVDRAYGGPHLPRDAHTVADCRLLRAEEVGDHVVAFGAVTRVSGGSRAVPLLYGRRRYTRWPADR